MVTFIHSHFTSLFVFNEAVEVIQHEVDEKFKKRLGNPHFEYVLLKNQDSEECKCTKI